MIHPSYKELLEKINEQYPEEEQISSRYSLVLAASKRARQIVGGADPLVEHAYGKKALSVAVDELYQGKVNIIPHSEEDEENAASAEAESETELSGTEETAAEQAETDLSE